VEKASFLRRVGAPTGLLSDIADDSQDRCSIDSIFASTCIGPIRGSYLVEGRRNRVLSLPTVFVTLDAEPSIVAFDAMPIFHRLHSSAHLHSTLMHPRLLNGHLNPAVFRRVECGECGG
jgi:hypothetical protein